jgi:transitional endoplasmic reticulum ATPase
MMKDSGLSTLNPSEVCLLFGLRGFTTYTFLHSGWKGEEGGIADVFEKARQMSPCVVVFEDLDSLINDGNRSFFLNQLDGIEGNDGLLIIATTNHFERLDPGLSSRPSRFDRK